MKLDLFRRASVSFNPDVYFSAVVWPTHFIQKMVGRFSDSLLSSRSRPVQPMLQFAAKKLIFSNPHLGVTPMPCLFQICISKIYFISRKFWTGPFEQTPLIPKNLLKKYISGHNGWQWSSSWDGRSLETSICNYVAFPDLLSVNEFDVNLSHSNDSLCKTGDAAGMDIGIRFLVVSKHHFCERTLVNKWLGSVTGPKEKGFFWKAPRLVTRPACHACGGAPWRARGEEGGSAVAYQQPQSRSY